MEERENLLNRGNMENKWDIILWKMTKKAVLSSIGFSMEFLIDTINFYYIGKCEKEEVLACYGLGSSLVFILAISYTEGMCSGIDTLCSQAFGANNYTLVGLWLNRGLIIIELCMLPALFLCIRMDLVLIFLGQDKNIAEGVGVFLRWAIPTILLYGVFTTFLKLVTSFQKFHIFSAVVAISAALQLLWGYVFIDYMRLGLKGAALSFDCTLLVDCSLFIIYYIYSENFAPLRKVKLQMGELVQGWKEFLSISVGATLMHIPRTWGFMFLTTQAAYLGTTNLGAQSILQNIYWILWALSLGIVYMMSALIGNTLGQGIISSIPLYKRVGLIFAVCSGILLNGCLLLFQGYIVSIYTEHPEVSSLVRNQLPYVVLCSLSNQILAVHEGILRGFGMQKMAGKTNYIPYLLISQPLAFLLAHLAGLEVVGLWVAWSIASLIAMGLYVLHVSRLDMGALVGGIQEALKGKGEVNTWGRLITELEDLSSHGK